ncbi:LacI family DNA-binding transcriptional regulator [Streptococcus massiliensis]|uniref:Transcriptional regulator n=1 Tax=Streptococcus massiliensis TaxID=313439 RepID=A0A380KYK7_9STRE|nr:LacI family DNA-binding transcriptional regulator [Streptococcus massiliensis]SUN76651.1 transcriptional regulator [Streptococcus massiliensis]
MVAKLTDVAELAGCSPTTVSRVINKKGYLSDKTVQKVKKAMRELGYKPNNVARSLQGKPAKLIGLIFPNISNVFYAELIDKLEHELFKHGYKTIICNSEHDSTKEREYIEMLEANQVDGIISGSHNLGISDYDRVTAPIISFDRNLSPDIPVVSSDNYAGGVLAAETLVKAGAQKIIMITGNDNSNSPTGLRHAGFASVLPDAAIINVSSDFSPIRKEMEIKNILTTVKLDAIFASDDLTAILIMKVAGELGIQLPQELKVIGYDGTYFVENYYPHLATIKQPMKEIATLCVDLLLKKIAGQEVKTTGYFLPVTLLPGKSV